MLDDSKEVRTRYNEIEFFFVNFRKYNFWLEARIKQSMIP